MGQNAKIRVDGVEREVDGSLTFAALSEQIKNEISPHRVIVEVFQSGESLSLNDEDQIRFQLLQELNGIEFKTKDVASLFRESLSLAPKICEAMELDIGDIEQLFTAGDLRQAQERVGELTSLVEWLLELFSGIQALGNQKLEEMTFSKGRVIDAVQRMNTELLRLHTVMLAQKWDEFRGHLTGSFCEEVKVWRQLFTDVASTWQPSEVVRSSSSSASRS